MEKAFCKTRLRNKGQITVHPEVRQMLGADEGDDLCSRWMTMGGSWSVAPRSFPHTRRGFGASAGSAWKRLPRLIRTLAE